MYVMYINELSYINRQEGKSNSFKRKTISNNLKLSATKHDSHLYHIVESRYHELHGTVVKFRVIRILLKGNKGSSKQANFTGRFDKCGCKLWSVINNRSIIICTHGV